MTDLPSKDTIEAVEKRVGTLPMKVLLWTIIVALALTAAGAIVTRLRASFTWLQPYIPAQLELNETVFRMATILVYALVGVGAWVVARRFQKFARDAEQAVAREGVALDAIVESEGKIKELQKKVGNIEGRLAYVEKKVGDELTDVLTKQLIEYGDKRYSQKPEIIPGTTAGNIRIENGKKILREAAAEARRAVKGDKLDFSSSATADRGWLHMLLIRFAREILAPGTFAKLREADSIREEKMKQRNQSPDGKDHFIKTAEYYENLAENLRLEDLDRECDPLPASFEQFRKSQS